MNRLLKGAVAGTIATVPMTIFMLLVNRQIPEEDREPLPPRQITKNAAEGLGIKETVDEEGEREALSLINHFAFGATAGAIYAPAALMFDMPPLVKGVAYGLKVWTVSYLGWLPAAGLFPAATRQPASQNALMIAAHVVWGAALAEIAERLEANDSNSSL